MVNGTMMVSPFRPKDVFTEHVRLIRHIQHIKHSLGNSHLHYILASIRLLRFYSFHGLHRKAVETGLHLMNVTNVNGWTQYNILGIILRVGVAFQLALAINHTTHGFVKDAFQALAMKMLENELCHLQTFVSRIKLRKHDDSDASMERMDQVTAGLDMDALFQMILADIHNAIGMLLSITVEPSAGMNHLMYANRIMTTLYGSNHVMTRASRNNIHCLSHGVHCTVSNCNLMPKKHINFTPDASFDTCLLHQLNSIWLQRYLIKNTERRRS